MKKIAAFLLLTVVLVMLSGCEKGPTDEEAKEIVAGLVEKSYEFNVIYFGEGMPAEADSDEDYVGYYSRLTDDAPYLTEAELREATLGVYTEKYASVLFQTFLSGINDPDTGGVVYARYVENGDRLTKMVDYEPFVEKQRTYDLENITIDRSKPDEIKATLKSFIDGKEDVDVTLIIRREERTPETAETAAEGSETGRGEPAGLQYVWRLDSPTY